MTVDTARLLTAFGIREPVTIERAFETPLGLPKFVARLTSGQRVFIGSLGVGWPPRDRLEALLPKLNALGCLLGDTEQPNICVTLGPYFKTPTGDSIVHSDDHHYFLTSYFTGEGMHPDRDVELMAHALGAFHRAGSAFASLSPFTTGDLIRDELANQTLPQLRAASVQGMPDPEGLLSRVIGSLEWITGERADAIDALPRTLAHNDFQPKNLLVRRDTHRTTIRVIDVETASTRSRLFDLYFLLMGSDEGNWLGDLDRFGERVRSYRRVAPAFTLEECLLLPNVLQCKAAGIAAWASAMFGDATRSRQEFLSRYFQAALRCFVLLHDHRQQLRTICS